VRSLLSHGQLVEAKKKLKEVEIMEKLKNGKNCTCAVMCVWVCTHMHACIYSYPASSVMTVCVCVGGGYSMVVQITN
jgi:hypothetical protein